MKLFSILILLMLGLSVGAQTVSTASTGTHFVAERSISFTDAGLQTPTVNAKLWYPGQTTGQNAPLANGQFPVIAFGHGFNLSYLDYSQICSHFASWGYIVVSPDVQNGFNVDHLEFAKQLSACLNYLALEGQNMNSAFYQHVDTMTGVIGHSMGGGASALVPSVFPQIDAVSGLAAAETNPSAIASLANYSGPYQIISGSADNTAPESTHQIPMYNAATGNKQWVSISGGAHCKFTDGSTVCDFVSSAGSVTRPFQIYLSKKYATAFFNYYLKGDANALPFLCGDSLAADQNRNFVSSQTTINCSTVGLNQQELPTTLRLSPNPASDQIRIQGAEAFTIYDAYGQQLLSGAASSEGTIVDLKSLKPGIYICKSHSSNGSILFVKN